MEWMSWRKDTTSTEHSGRNRGARESVVKWLTVIFQRIFTHLLETARQKHRTSRCFCRLRIVYSTLLQTILTDFRGVFFSVETPHLCLFLVWPATLSMAKLLLIGVYGVFASCVGWEVNKFIKSQQIPYRVLLAFLFGRRVANKKDDKQN